MSYAAEVGSPDLKFCSATYRLVKTAWESSPTHDPMVDVEYKGVLHGVREYSIDIFYD